MKTSFEKKYKSKEKKKHQMSKTSLAWLHHNLQFYLFIKIVRDGKRKKRSYHEKPKNVLFHRDKYERPVLNGFQRSSL